MPLSFALSTVNINQCWQIVPLYKEIIKRGHRAQVFASLHNSSSFIPLNLEGIPWEALELTTKEELQKKPYDIIIESDRNLSEYALKGTGFSIGFFPGGCGHWITTGDNLPALARHVLWIGHHVFEQESRIIQGHSGRFPHLGMPSLSNYKDYRLKKPTKPLKGLYFNGPPFKPENKKRFIHFLRELAEKNPHVSIDLKERFLGKDLPNHYVLGLIELDAIPSVHIYDGYSSGVELVKEADFLIGLSSTAFIEALYIKKPVFIPRDFDNEFLYGVKTGSIYPQCQGGFTRVTSQDLVERFDACFSGAHSLSEKEYLANFPYQDPCKMIIDLVELIEEVKGSRSIDHMNISLPFETFSQYREDLKCWIKRVDQEKEKLYEEREENLYLMTIFSEVLRHIRYILPKLPQEIYQQFVKDFKEKFSEHKKDAEWQVALFEEIGPLFYKYVENISGIHDTWFPEQGTLFDKYSEKYIEEAIRCIPAFHKRYQEIL